MNRKDEFKFYVLQEQVFLLEKLMIENHIEFHNEQEITQTSSLKYYINNKDRPKLDQLVKKNNIILKTDSIPFIEHRLPEKVNFSLILVFTLILSLIVFIVWLT